MSEVISNLVRATWLIECLLVLGEVVIGIRGSLADARALRASGKNGVILFSATARTRRWLLRAGLVGTMFYVSVLSLLAPQQALCPGGVRPAPSATGVAIVFGLLLVGLWLAVIFGDDILARRALNDYTLDQLIEGHALSEAPNKENDHE